MAQEAKIFKYQTPEFQGVKKLMILCNSDLMKVMVQVVKDGGTIFTRTPAMTRFGM